MVWKRPASAIGEKLRRHKRLFEAQKATTGEKRIAADVAFAAEDLVRGYAVDVMVVQADAAHRVAHPKWLSLCRHVTRYEIFNPTTQRSQRAWPVDQDAEEEGFVALSATNVRDDNNVEWLKVSPALFRWTGWSLAVPVPTKTIAAADPGGALNQLRTTPFLPPYAEDNNLPSPSLPRLRFGWRYKFRLRAVDLAGNCVTVDEASALTAGDDSHVSKEVVYGRVDPIQPPLVVCGNDHEPGTSLARGAPVDRCVITTTCDAHGALTIRTSAEYHFLLPRVAIDLFDQHGEIERQQLGYSTLDLLDQPWVPSSAAERSLRQIDTVPYLCDPAAGGITFVGLPGGAGDAFYVVRPDPGAARSRILVKVEVGAGQPGLVMSESGESTMGVKMRADGGIVRVRASCCPTPGYAPPGISSASVWQSELYRRALVLAARTDVGQLEHIAASGGHTLLSTYREIEFVHALQQPYLAPVVARAALATPQVTPEDTKIQIALGVNAHKRSTGTLSFVAQWNDCDDYGQAVPRESSIGEYQIAHPPDDQSDQVNAGSPTLDAYSVPLTQTFSDGRYRSVSFVAVGHSRFAEFFPELSTTLASAPSQPIDVLNPSRPAPVKAVRCLPTFSWSGPPVAPGSRRRERPGVRIFLEPPLFTSGPGEKIGVVVFDGDATTGSDALRTSVSLWGKDPIWDSETPVTPILASMFLDARAKPFPASALGPGLPAGASIKILPYEIQGLDQRQPFIDVILDAGAAYFPFIRLAIVRYQEKSISPAVSISSPTLCEAVQLLPWRQLDVAVGSDTIDVALFGPSYSGSQVSTAEDKRQALVDLCVDQQVFGLWTRVRKQRLNKPDDQGAGAGTVKWTYKGLPVPVPADDGPIRLVVMEYEQLASDRGMLERLVYADSVGIPREGMGLRRRKRTRLAFVSTFDRTAALGYARTHWNRSCADGFIAGQFGGDNFVRAGADTMFIHEFDENGAPLPREHASLPDGTTLSWEQLDDCTHFISNCLGSEGGGGIALPRDFPSGPYGILSANRLVTWLVDNDWADVMSAPKTNPQLDRISPGDLIGYFQRSRNRYAHLAMYAGADKIICHTYCRSDDPACSWDNSFRLGEDDTDWEWRLIHIRAPADSR